MHAHTCAHTPADPRWRATPTPTPAPPPTHPVLPGHAAYNLLRPQTEDLFAFNTIYIFPITRMQNQSRSTLKSKLDLS